MTAKFGRRVHVSVPTDRKPPNWFLATAPNLLHRAVKVTRAVFLTSDDGQRTTGLRDGRIQNTPAASTITKFQVGISSLEHRTEQQKKKINFTVEIRFFFFFSGGSDYSFILRLPPVSVKLVGDYSIFICIIGGEKLKYQIDKWTTKTGIKTV